MPTRLDFTVHGSGNDAKFDLDIFKSHARELLLLTWAPNVMSDIVTTRSITSLPRSR